MYSKKYALTIPEIEAIVNNTKQYKRAEIQVNKDKRMAGLTFYTEEDKPDVAMVFSEVI